MARHSEPGLTHYNMNCDHIYNKKIRLLISEFGADGYWVWSCIVSEAYRTNGYYFNMNDKDELELFASDVCKKQVALVKEVVSGCVRRSLFNEGVFNVFGILTSVHMQDFYIKATKERRKKGTIVLLKEDYLLTNIDANEVNITILPRTKQIIPRTKDILPGTKPQSKVKESTVVESKENNISTTGNVLPGAAAPATPKTFKQWTEKEFAEEIAKHSSLFSYDLRNNFFKYWKERNAKATKMKFQLERTWETKSRLETWQRNEEIFGSKKPTTHTNNQKPANDVLKEYEELQKRNAAKYGG